MMPRLVWFVWFVCSSSLYNIFTREATEINILKLFCRWLGMDEYKSEGFAQAAVGATITLIVGVGIATLVLIFVGTLGGQTYNLAEPQINNISDATIQQYVKDGVTNSFKAQAQTAQYMPLIVLAVVITLVLALVLSMGMGVGGAGRGGAL
jgi:hypothetical protein